MATAMSTSNFSFPGPIGTKRRRMRSGGNVSTVTNNTPHQQGETADGASAPPAPKCKATAIPIFLKSKSLFFTYCMMWIDLFLMESTIIPRNHTAASGREITGY